MGICGLALGDVDGDDKIETVILSKQKVLILRNENGHFTKIKEISGRKNQKFVSVDVENIKKDGQVEKLDGSLKKQKEEDKLMSSVIEDDGAKEDGKVMNEAVNKGVSFSPDVMFDKLSRN